MTISCYIDTNIFLNVIYEEAHHAKGSRILLEKIQKGELAGLMSSVTEMEVALDMEKTGNRERIDDALRLIERMNNLTICPLSSWTARMAAKLVFDSHLTVHDAYHGATAMENGATLFVTRDRTLGDRLKKMIKVSAPEAIELS